MKKLTIFTIGIASLLLLLTGCGNQEKSDPTVMTILLDEQPAEGDALIEALDIWSEETGNSYETLIIPYDDQLTMFRSMVQNNDAPDLIATTRLTRLYPEEFIDLSQYLDTDIFEQDILKVIGQNYTLEEVLLLPLQYTVSNFYYNKDAFEAAGIEEPTLDNPWTLDELYENAAKLQESNAVQYGFAVDYSRARYDNFMYSNGGSHVERLGDSYRVTANSQQNIATLQQFIDMNNEGVLPRVIWTGGSNDNPADFFANAMAGILLSGSWQHATFSNNITDFEWGVMPAPVGTDGASTILGGSGLAIPSIAKNSELAIEFLKWFYEDVDNHLRFLKSDNGLPFLEGVEFVHPDPKVEADFTILKAEVDNVKEAFMIDEESGWRNFLDNEYRDLLRQAVSGELTAEEALNNFAAQLSERAEWQLVE